MSCFTCKKINMQVCLVSCQHVSIQWLLTNPRYLFRFACEPRPCSKSCIFLTLFATCVNETMTTSCGPTFPQADIFLTRREHFRAGQGRFLCAQLRKIIFQPLEDREKPRVIRRPLRDFEQSRLQLLFRFQLLHPRPSFRQWKFLISVV